MNDHLFTLKVNTDKALVSRDSVTERILEVRLQAPARTTGGERPALNLGLVLDRSGSMAGMKLEYVKLAAIHVLDQLTEQDQVALVVYDNIVRVLANSTRVTPSSRSELKRVISRIDSGNMTNLSEGWLTGCREIAASTRDGMINRSLLLTDGLANVGITDEEDLARHALELYKDSISTSTFGVGEGFNEHMLEAMANRGGGNFYYIANPELIPGIFLKEFEDILGITVRNVEVSLELPAAVKWEIFAGWPGEYKDGSLQIHVGDMLSGKQQDIYLRLQIPADANADELTIRARAFGRGAGGMLLESEDRLAWKYAPKAEVEAAAEDVDLMKRFSEVELAHTAAEALKLERRGEREAAHMLLHDNIARSSRHISPMAAENYTKMSGRMRTGMTEADRKQTHFDVYNIKRKKEDQEEK